MSHVDGKNRDRKKSPDMTDRIIHLSNVSAEYAEVRRGYDIIGTVKRIDRLHVVNGLAKIEHRWEARRILDFFTFEPYSLSTFPTRREAVNYLAEEH